ncbi:MAG: hypothetical protein WCY26_11060 [Thiohalobacteraceae bacterium]|nr:hypothetical protein [Gammaproteobacteria bacterium]
MRLTQLLGLLLWSATLAQAGELVIAAGDKLQTFDRYWEDYERCKAREEFTPVRGEYETQTDYRRRVEILRVGCDTYRRIEAARIDIPVALRYDVDARRFLFELPVTKGLRLQYEGLVRDDFPPLLAKLPRDRWHIDDPTPKASAYKACTLRSAQAADGLIGQIEPCRTDSWRGCMTYYQRDVEVGWRREEDAFFIGDVTFYAYADVPAARRIKDMERDLVYRIEGVLTVPEQSFEARRVEIVNRVSGERLVTLEQ